MPLNAKFRKRTADQMIAKIRECEREVIIALYKTRVSRLEKLDKAKNQLQALLKQINQAIEFSYNLIQSSSSSDIMQSKEILEKRFEDLYRIAVPTVPVGSYVTFVSTAEPKDLTLGVIATDELTTEGLTQDFQAGVEAEFALCSKLQSETGGLFH